MTQKTTDISISAKLDWNDNQQVLIESVGNKTIRVRLASNDNFEQSLLNRYGFIHHSKHAPALNSDGSQLHTDNISIAVSPQNKQITFSDHANQTLAKIGLQANTNNSGFTMSWQVDSQEKFCGLGDQRRDRIELRGTKADLWVRNVDSYIPIPFFFSSKGYGVLVNTTRRHQYDIADTNKDTIAINSDKGNVDFYFIAGTTPKEIINTYTNLTGKPQLPPKWSFGLWFICRTQANDHEVLSNAADFRRDNIPCDLIGLEPGWMEENYDYSLEKTWSNQRFPIPSYDKNYHFIKALNRMGYKLMLWLCNDYDLTYEAERKALKNGNENDKDTGEHNSANIKAEEDEHFSMPIYLDKITKPETPWFDHLKPFVDQGAVMFKQDGALQVLDHPDRVWGNGLLDDQVHNLYPLLYSKQMYQGYKEHTGKRGCGFTAAGWAGLQRWTGTWTGDTGGGPQPLTANINLGLCGHSWTTCDMDVTTKQSIHAGMLMPWAQINSWTYFRHPWLQGKNLCNMIRDYVHLRYRLLPYLYSAAGQSNQTGTPMLRGLPIEFPDDNDSYQIAHQFMLGEALLVTAFKNEIYFPPGRWRDMWTGKIFDGANHTTYQPPENRGGGLFQKDGTIIVTGQNMDYIGEKPDDEFTMEIFSDSHGQAQTVLYEDDGQSYEYEKGKFSTTKITYEAKDGGREARSTSVLEASKNNSANINIAPADGEFDGMIKKRTWKLRLRDVTKKPNSITANNQPLHWVNSEIELSEKTFFYCPNTQTLFADFGMINTNGAEINIS